MTVMMMIYRVEIENFYSVRERQVIDLAVREEEPNDSRKVVKIGDSPDMWVPRIAAVYGPNASGKSNVLRAISFVKLFATSSAFGSSNRQFSYFKFMTPEAASSPTRLSISFASDRYLLPKESYHLPDRRLACKYIYTIVLSGVDENEEEKVISESLFCSYGNDGDNICIFERDESGKVKMLDKVTSNLDVLENSLEVDASVISTLWKVDDEFASSFSIMMSSIYTNILIDRVDSSHNYIKEYSDDEGLLESLNSELGRFDFGASGVHIYEGLDGVNLCFNHDGLSSNVTMGLESLGTKRFVANYPILRNALKNGGIAVVDEFDISLHPMVLPEIVGWFEDPEKNPHGAQLWMTCHSVTLMRSLVKEGIVICEKNRRGSSSVYSLGSVEGVQSNEDFMDGYLLGVFGGVPMIG